MKAAWRAKEKPCCEAALLVMRSVVPPAARGASVATLVAQGLPLLVARRVAHNPVLSLVAIRSADIARMHPVNLTALGFSGLDIVELRAVFAALPEDFVNDSDGKKGNWRDTLQAKLKQLTDTEAAGALQASQLRHACYAALAPSGGVGPFDAEAELPSMQVRRQKCFKCSFTLLFLVFKTPFLLPLVNPKSICIN